MPFNLPLSAGRTRATAFAAPVDVGTILSAAALARLRSRWLASSSRWSPVYECVVVMVPLIMPAQHMKNFIIQLGDFLPSTKLNYIVTMGE